MKTVKTPWKDYIGDIPFTTSYFDGSIYDCVNDIRKKYPNNIACDFEGKAISYSELIDEINIYARALYALGVRENDVITIAMPNCVQVVCLFYAINLIGGVSNIVHPLSSESELEFYINFSKSKLVFTLDQFYTKLNNITSKINVNKIVIGSVVDYLPITKKIGYMFTEARRIDKVDYHKPFMKWSSFINGGKNVEDDYYVKRNNDDVAAILYSGGTTGYTKGVELTNLNFNALAKQVFVANPSVKVGDTMLAAMPNFHGFGLGVCIHAPFANGCRSILVPRFTPESYVRLIEKYKCNLIAGVPTLFEALLRLDNIDNIDLSSLKGIFSGGDNLSIELKKRIDDFLKAHKSPVTVREGYGMTETVAACLLTNPYTSKEGSIGIPFPDTYVKIVKPGKYRQLAYGREGEILLSGPTVMKGYLNNPEETSKALRMHSDGRLWLYTGDLGLMDSDGFVYFKGRIKRMIITSGYNVYPNQLENIISNCDLVSMCCVIGVPDKYRMQKVKAFIVLKDGIKENEETKGKILDYCKKHIAKYALPREIEFRKELPKTLIGKISYRKLETQESRKKGAVTK